MFLDRIFRLWLNVVFLDSVIRKRVLLGFGVTRFLLSMNLTRYFGSNSLRFRSSLFGLIDLVLSTLHANSISNGRIFFDEVYVVSILFGHLRFIMFLIPLITKRCLEIAEFRPLVIKYFLLGFIPFVVLIFVSSLF